MEDSSEKVDEVAENLGSIGSDESSDGILGTGGKNSQDSMSKEETESISKEEIAKEFDGVFVKTPKGEVQHLAHEDLNSTVCGKDLNETEYNASDEYGPFDPICENCIQSLGIGAETTKTKMELREELAEEVPGVDPSYEGGSIRKREVQAILDHIHELKKQS